MTKVEAAEWVMRDGIVFCSPCEGKGFTFDGFNFPQCITCEGYGQVVAPEYIQAIVLLGTTLSARVMKFLALLKPEQLGRMSHGTELYVRRNQ